MVWPNDETKTLYRATLWHSALYGLFAVCLYLTILAVSTGDFSNILRSADLYGACIAFITGLISWQWRIHAAIIWTIVLFAIALVKATWLTDSKPLLAISFIALLPSLTFEGVNFIAGEDVR